jgi:hypothetical protein
VLRAPRLLQSRFANSLGSPTRKVLILMAMVSYSIKGNRHTGQSLEEMQHSALSCLPPGELYSSDLR